jgi:hypothetical protein
MGDRGMLTSLFEVGWKSVEQAQSGDEQQRALCS